MLLHKAFLPDGHTKLRSEAGVFQMNWGKTQSLDDSSWEWLVQVHCMSQIVQVTMGTYFAITRVGK